MPPPMHEPSVAAGPVPASHAARDDVVALTPKGRRTRARIVDAAIDLLGEMGYEGASMRAIARRAGVSVGNAYYYFPSKAHLVQAFYDRTRTDLAEAAGPILTRERSLEARLRGVLEAWIELIDPYHDAAAALFRTAADPASPLNPFSAESAPVRDQAIALYRDIVAGCDARLPPELREELPALLWTAHMGITLYWIHDPSAGRRRTRALISRAPALLTRLIALSGLPGMGELRRQVRDLIHELMGKE